MGYHFNKATGFRLVTVDPGSGATTTLQDGNSAAMITDFDVTADGLGVDYVRADGTGDRRRFDAPTLPLGSGLRVNAFRSSPSGNGPLHLDDATIQLIEVPGAPIAVLSDDKPVDLQLGGGDRRVNLRVTRYDDGAVSSTSTFSNLTGDVRAGSGAGGALATRSTGRSSPPTPPTRVAERPTRAAARPTRATAQRTRVAARRTRGVARPVPARTSRPRRCASPRCRPAAAAAPSSSPCAVA